MPVLSSTPFISNNEVHNNNKRRYFESINDETPSSTQTVTTITNNFDCTQLRLNKDDYDVIDTRIGIVELQLFALNKKFKRATDQVDTLQDMCTSLIDQMEYLQKEHNKMMSKMVTSPNNADELQEMYDFIDKMVDDETTLNYLI
jgi:CII-binding regulator of phage lambda lysogenization HflD